MLRSVRSRLVQRSASTSFLRLCWNLALGSRAELERDPVSCALPKPFADVVTANDEVPSVVGSTPHEDVDVRVVGIPMVDRNPFQLRPEVAFGVLHEFTREGAHVRHLHGVFGRDDEPEMMPVFGAAFGERLSVRVVRGRVEKACVLAIAGHAFTLEIGDMLGERRRDKLAATMAHDPGHDDDAPGRTIVTTGTRAARRPRPKVDRKLLAPVRPKLFPVWPAFFAARMTSPTKLLGRLAPR